MALSTLSETRSPAQLALVCLLLSPLHFLVMHITLKRSRYRSCSARKPHLLRRHETLQNASYLSCRSRTSSEIDLSSAEQGRLPGQDVSNLQTGPDLGCHGCQGSVSQTCSTRNPVGQGLSLILNTVSVLTRPALTPRRLHVLDLSGEGAADLASSLSIKVKLRSNVDISL